MRCELGRAEPRYNTTTRWRAPPSKLQRSMMPRHIIDFIVYEVEVRLLFPMDLDDVMVCNAELQRNGQDDCMNGKSNSLADTSKRKDHTAEI